MAWLSYVLVFIVSWWLFFFMVLPFGLQNATKDETGKVVDGTNAVGAPLKPKLLKKALITTVFAVLATLTYHAIYTYGLISFRPS